MFLKVDDASNFLQLRYAYRQTENTVHTESLLLLFMNIKLSDSKVHVYLP